MEVISADDRADKVVAPMHQERGDVPNAVEILQ
jgi:hypothetical protein